MKEIRLGTIGSGFIVETILERAKKTEGIVLEAAFSRSGKRAAELAEKFGFKKIYTELPEFFADERVNVVYIATPNILHFAQTKAALLAGKHVITEKPFVPTSDEAKELFDLAEERGLLLFEAAPTTFLPNFRVLKRLLPEIGKIRRVDSNYSQHSARFDLLEKGKLTNIFDPKMAGGCLMDINFYNILLNVALFGKPASAEYKPNFFPGAADVSGEAVLDYGSFISRNFGAKDRDGENFFLIEGEKGAVIVENGSNGLERIRLELGGEEKAFNEQGEADRWALEVAELTRLLLAEDRESARKHFQMTLSAVETIEALRRSAGIVFPCDLPG